MASETEVDIGDGVYVDVSTHEVIIRLGDKTQGQRMARALEAAHLITNNSNSDERKVAQAINKAYLHLSVLPEVHRED